MSSDESTSPPILELKHHDSKIDLWNHLDAKAASSSGQVNFKFKGYYFPNVMPNKFKTKNIVQENESEVSFTRPIPFIHYKYKDTPIFMYLIHPFKYKLLCEKMEECLSTNDISLNPQSLTTAWKESRKIFHLFSTSNDGIKEYRKELTDSFAGRYTCRFDIRNFYGSVYTHMLDSLTFKNIQEANQNFQDSQNNTASRSWAVALDTAVRECHITVLHLEFPLDLTLFHSLET
eukprot:NODE_490_length_6857_cov_0.383249.p3 type:complete len:233 gc:universal NODE_490_length_6857_cov_0.383249:4667-3969(-)